MINLNGTSKVFLDKEYSSEVSQTLLAVHLFSKVEGKSQNQSSTGILEILQTTGVFL